MLLTRLIQGLGALSLVHVAVAAEKPVFPRTNKTVESVGGDHVEDTGYGAECFGCHKTVTRTKTETTTCFETVTYESSICICVPV